MLLLQQSLLLLLLVLLGGWSVPRAAAQEPHSLLQMLVQGALSSPATMLGPCLLLLHPA
jgi:hypothetical protein